MEEVPKMADEELPQPSETTLYGREIKLSSGARVFGALHKNSAVWKFTSSEGAITHITLSTQAMSAMVQLYQGMLGCDENFATVGFEPLPDSAAGES